MAEATLGECGCGKYDMYALTRAAVTSQSSARNAIFAIFANGKSAEYAHDSVDAEDNDGDVQSVGKALIDERFFVRELGGIKAKHGDVIPFLPIGA